MSFSANVLEPFFFDHRVDIPVTSTTKILLIPHHLVAGVSIVSAMSSIPKPKTVYLLFPDHFWKVKDHVGVTDAVLRVGSTQLDNGLKNFVQANPKVPWQTAPKEIEGELSFQALVPLVARIWPDANVVPLMIGPKLSEESQERVSEMLASALNDPESLVLATADFTHEQPPEVADVYDKISEKIIFDGDTSRLDEVHVDTPNVLRIAMRVAQKSGLHVQELSHTHAARILQITDPKLWNDSTSHFIFNFYSP
ncbi:MAG: AmmeMemoRadiSam system protein B [bacterium]|nr:AmmeMemoRadiSam system protein B [bacterium]